MDVFGDGHPVPPLLKRLRDPWLGLAEHTATGHEHHHAEGRRIQVVRWKNGTG